MRVVNKLKGNFLHSLVALLVVLWSGMAFGALTGPATGRVVLENISALLSVSTPAQSMLYEVKGYHEAGDGGGGVFYWDATASKTDHNGGTIIDPDITFPTDWTDTTEQATWFTAAASGTGVWKRVVRDNSFSILWFGASDGTDVSKSIQVAIDSVDSVDLTWADVVPDARASVSAEITFPGNASYTVTAQIDVATNKSIRFTSDGPVGARLTYAPTSGEPADYMFLVKSGWHNVEFDRIAFDGGGIQFEDNVRAKNTITRCLFADITGDYAIKVGSGVVDGEVSRNFFSNCGGGVGITGTDSDLWVITHNNFARMRGPAVYSASTGVQVENNNFETMISTAYASPRVQLLNGLCQVVGNRFGDEHTVDGADTWTAPADQIVIGGDAVSTTPIGDVLVSGNFFLGTNDVPSATRARSAIRLMSPVNRLRITNNRFARYYDSLVSEYYYNDDATTQAWAEKAYDNVWNGNVVDLDSNAPAFSEGGIGFNTVVWNADNESGSEGRVADNRVSQDFTAWTSSNVSVAVNETDPAGATNSATTITRTAAGSAYVSALSTTTFSEGAAVFSVWVKSTSITDVRLGILETTNNKWLASNQATIVVTGQWQRYVVRAPSVPSGVFLRVYIFLNNINDATTSSGTVIAYAPRLEPGLTPTLQPLRTIGAEAVANVNTPSGATSYQWPVYDADGSLLGYVPVYGTAW